MKTNYLLTVFFVLFFSTPLKLSAEAAPDKIREYSLPVSYAEIEMITVTPNRQQTTDNRQQTTDNRQHQPNQYTVDIHIFDATTDAPIISRTVATEGEILDIDFVDVDDDEQLEFIVKTQSSSLTKTYNLDVFELKQTKLNNIHTPPLKSSLAYNHEKHRCFS